MQQQQEKQQEQQEIQQIIIEWQEEKHQPKQKHHQLPDEWMAYEKSFNKHKYKQHYNNNNNDNDMNTINNDNINNIIKIINTIRDYNITTNKYKHQIEQTVNHDTLLQKPNTNTTINTTTNNNNNYIHTTTTANNHVKSKEYFFYNINISHSLQRRYGHQQQQEQQQQIPQQKQYYHIHFRSIEKTFPNIKHPRRNPSQFIINTIITSLSLPIQISSSCSSFNISSSASSFYTKSPIVNITDTQQSYSSVIESLNNFKTNHNINTNIIMKDYNDFTTNLESILIQLFIEFFLIYYNYLYLNLHRHRKSFRRKSPSMSAITFSPSSLVGKPPADEGILASALKEEEASSYYLFCHQQMSIILNYSYPNTLPIIGLS